MLNNVLTVGNFDNAIGLTGLKSMSMSQNGLVNTLPGCRKSCLLLDSFAS
jgi:hypothetical protein